MELRIKETSDGYEVAQILPTTLAVFTTRDHADLFCCALISEEDFGTDEDAEITDAYLNDVSEEDPAEAPVRPVETPMQQASTDLEEEIRPALPTDEPWTEGEVKEAFTHLEKGEKIKTVASWYGKSWVSLRARWAGERTRKNAATKLVPVEQPKRTPVEAAKAAIEELSDQTECRVCSRHFKATPDNLDLCARCAHEGL